MEKNLIHTEIETVYENPEEYAASSMHGSIKNLDTSLKLINKTEEKTEQNNNDNKNNGAKELIPKIFSKFKEKHEHNDSNSKSNLIIIDKKRFSKISLKSKSKRLSSSNIFKPSLTLKCLDFPNNFPIVRRATKKLSDISLNKNNKEDLNKSTNRRPSRYPIIKFGSDNKLTQISNETDDINFSTLIKYRRLRLKESNSIKMRVLNKKKEKFIQNLIKNDQDLMKKKRQFEKIKKYACILIVSSILSIIFSCIDSEIYLYNSYNYIFDNKIPIEEYYKIKNRKIYNGENWVRYLNIVFCISCFIMSIRIFITKLDFTNEEGTDVKSKFKKKINNHIPYSINNEQHLKMRSNSSVLKLIIRSLINIIFYPPYVNYVFRSSFDNKIYITPLNTIFLFFNTFKLYNIYRCIFYFLPITSALGKVQCNKYNVPLNVKYMFRALNSKSPILFPLIVVGIILTLFTFLIHGTEKFSVDLNDNSDTYNNLKGINSNEPRRLGYFSDNLWINASTLVSVIFSDYYLLSPVTKALMFLIKITGTLFICIIYYRLNLLVLLDTKDNKAYRKLEKLFKPENKENKACDVIRALLLVKKVVVENEKHIEFYHQSIFNSPEEIQLIDPINLHKHNIKYIKKKFVFFSKFFTDISNFSDAHKVSRNLPLPINTMFQNMEDTMEESLDSLNYKLDFLSTIDTTLGSMKQHNIILMKKIEKVIKHDIYILNYLCEVINKNNKEMAKEKLHQNMRRQNSLKNIKEHRNNSCHFKNKRTKTISISKEILSFGKNKKTSSSKLEKVI